MERQGNYLAQRRREEALEHYRELLESMGRLGIKLLCYNFMGGKGWSRTGVREGRCGAKATYFSLEAMNHVEQVEQAELHASTCSTWLKLSHEQVWANYEYFIKAVMPTAEKCGVRMGLHPDDPCLSSLGGGDYSVLYCNEDPRKTMDRILKLHRECWRDPVEAAGGSFYAAKGNHDLYVLRKDDEKKTGFGYSSRHTRDILMDTAAVRRAMDRMFNKEIFGIKIS